MSEVKVCTVTRENADRALPFLLKAVERSAFIAIDTEFTGLGNSLPPRGNRADERYLQLRTIVSRQSLLSVGIACFSVAGAGANGEADATAEYTATTFEILCMRNDDTFEVTPSSMRFLACSGFDLTRAFRSGLPFLTSGSSSRTKGVPLTDAVVAILKGSSSKCPIVLHNGLLDLMFLWHSFVGDLPDDIQGFASALASLPCAPVFDTKFVAETRRGGDGGTFLERLFRRCERDNGNCGVCDETVKHPPRRFIVVSQADVPSDVQAESSAAETVAKTEQKRRVCSTFACIGHCSLGALCPDSHCVTDVLDKEDEDAKGDSAGTRPRTKKKKPTDMDIAAEAACSDGTDGATAPVVPTPPPPLPASTSSVANAAPNRSSAAAAHCAGFDAFATGFVFAYFARTLPNVRETTLDKVFLAGKLFPLSIRRSQSQIPNQ